LNFKFRGLTNYFSANFHIQFTSNYCIFNAFPLKFHNVPIDFPIRMHDLDADRGRFYRPDAKLSARKRISAPASSFGSLMTQVTRIQTRVRQ
jgi:hypothetical protein